MGEKCAEGQETKLRRFYTLLCIVLKLFLSLGAIIILKKFMASLFKTK